jgi:hypothetical protein
MASVWQRAVYKPPKKIISKAKIWNRRTAPMHYNLKYTWVPQPLVHNAVNQLFNEKSYRDFHKDSQQLFVKDFREGIKEETKKHLFEETKSRLIETVSDVKGEFLFQTQLPEEVYDSSAMLDYGGNLENDSAIDRDSIMSSLDGSSVASFSSQDERDNQSLGSYYDPETKSVISRGSKSQLNKPKDHQKATDKDQSSKKPGETPKKETRARDKKGKTSTKKLQLGESGEKEQTFLSQPPATGGMVATSSTTKKSGQLQIRSQSYSNLVIGNSNIYSPSGMSVQSTGVSLRHNLSQPSINFPEFIHETQPGKLVKSKDVLETSANTIVVQNEEMHRKFRYRPLGRNDAKIDPMHPYGWR